MNSLPNKHPLLNTIGVTFMASGAHQRAVEAFLKLGDVAKAVDACAHLNQWHAVGELCQSHQQLDEREIMGRYAGHLAGNSHLSAALRVFQEFRLPREAAMLLDKEGEIAFQRTRKMIFAKKCFVFSATLLDQDPEGKAMAEAEWKKAEAVHFFIVAHRQMYAGQWQDAIVTAARIQQVYADFVGKEAAAAMLAVCGFHSRFLKQCSNGFIYLENANGLSKRKKDKISHIAVRIFGKSPPNDPADLDQSACRKCKKLMTPPKVKCSCGAISVPSIVSGRPITVRGGVWKCQKCKHFALQEEIAELEVCPLCHTTIA
jgi:WD repeat-containing protein 35